MILLTPHINALHRLETRGLWEPELPVAVLRDLKAGGCVAVSDGRVTLTQKGRDALKVAA